MLLEGEGGDGKWRYGELGENGEVCSHEFGKQAPKTSGSGCTGGNSVIPDLIVRMTDRSVLRMFYDEDDGGCLGKDMGCGIRMAIERWTADRTVDDYEWYYELWMMSWDGLCTALD